MPLRILRLRGLVASSVVRGLLVTGMYSTFFLGTLYLEHVRHYSALQTGLAFLPWTMTVGDPLARRHRAPGRALRADARAGPRAWSSVIAGLLLLRARPGAHRASSRPSSSPTSPSAWASATPSCRCCTIAMADVPAQDAGLGSGIVNVSQQVAGALGLAVLGTLATNHSKALLAQHHTVPTRCSAAITSPSRSAWWPSSRRSPPRWRCCGRRGPRRPRSCPTRWRWSPRSRLCPSSARPPDDEHITPSQQAARRAGDTAFLAAHHHRPSSAARPARGSRGPREGGRGTDGGRGHRGRPLVATHRQAQPARADAMTA